MESDRQTGRSTKQMVDAPSGVDPAVPPLTPAHLMWWPDHLPVPYLEGAPGEEQIQEVVILKAQLTAWKDRCDNLEVQLRGGHSVPIAFVDPDPPSTTKKAPLPKAAVRVFGGDRRRVGG